MTTSLHLDDAGFVRAPESRCYRVLTHLGRWPTFWPATAVHVRSDDQVRVLAGPRLPARPRLRLELEAGAWRHDAGFTMQVGGDVDGSWEVWLEPLPTGTVVHHVVVAVARRPWHPRALRRWIRHGLWGLKDAVEDDVRRAMLDAPAADGGVARSSTEGPVR